MRHLIWTPAVDEVIPDNTIAYDWCEYVPGGMTPDGEAYDLPVNCVSVVACIVDHAFTTAGTILYERDEGQPPTVLPARPMVHFFAGWEI